MLSCQGEEQVHSHFWDWDFGADTGLLAQRARLPAHTRRAAPTLRSGGYIIDFWGLGYDIAERMGLLPALKAEGYDISELRFVNDRGRRVGGFGVNVSRRSPAAAISVYRRSTLAKLIYKKIEGRCKTLFDVG